MAELLKNELTTEIDDDGSVITQRVIRDKNTPEEFKKAVEGQQNHLEFMKKFVDSFDERVKAECDDIRKKMRGQNTNEINSKIKTHKLYMNNQKQLFVTKQIPSIESELPLLVETLVKMEAKK